MKIKTNYSAKHIAACLWITFSIIYILWDLYQNTVIGMYNKGYIAAQNATIQTMIQEVKNDQCEPISISSEKDKVTVINVECLNTSPKE